MTTKIEWCSVPDGSGGFKIPRTLNHQVGCREVSPACRECYAAKLAHRGMSKQHKGLTVMRANAAGENLGVHWNGEINRVPTMLAEPLRWRKPSGVFVGSMTDTFFDVESEDACRWIAALFGIMAACPQHTLMRIASTRPSLISRIAVSATLLASSLLTKRPENAARWFAWLDGQAAAKVERGTSPDLDHARQSIAWECARQHVVENLLGDLRFAQGQPWPLPSVWIGVTAEDQRRADERVPVLLGLPAAVRFVSCEPMVGPVDWTRIKWPGRESTVDVLRGGSWDLDPAAGFVQHSDMATLDLLIAGGESGPRARPAHPDWFRSARDQCEAAGVPFFFKQWGEWAIEREASDVDDLGWLDASEVDRVHRTDWPTPVQMRRVGKAAAGRELDGRTHDGFPEVRHG